MNADPIAPAPMARLVIVLSLLLALAGCRGRPDPGSAPDDEAVASWSDMLTREEGNTSP